jgi:hypothetical protein
MDETLALLAVLPFIGVFFRRLHNWWHAKHQHKCHEESCNETHVEHCHMPANIPHGKVGQSQCEQHPLSEPVAVEEQVSYSLNLRGLVVATVIFNEPMTHEEVVTRLPNEDSDKVHATINELVEEGSLILDGDLLKEGNIFQSMDEQ